MQTVQQQKPFKEKRRSARARVFFGGEILVDAQLAPVECHVRNISAGGAALVVHSGDLIPDRFELFLRKSGIAGHSCSKNGAASLAYLPAISFPLAPPCHDDRDGRNKSGHDLPTRPGCGAAP